MPVLKKILIVALMLSLPACTMEGGNETSGTLVGAAVGGLLGSQIGSGSGQLAATAIGVLAGAYIGGELGRRMDEADRQKMARTTQRALETGPSGEAVNWTNPDKQVSGSVTPQPAYQNRNDQYCREYQQTVTIGGETQTAYGTACRQADGSWRISNS